MCCFRHCGHQQRASTPGIGTTGGSSVHQHGALPPSAIAQPNSAPQRVHLLIEQPRCSFLEEIGRPSVADS
jgi:hypothetical protein